MMNQNTGGFTPDCGMRRRNQDCGCRTQAGRRPVRRPMPMPAPAPERPCSCNQNPVPPAPPENPGRPAPAQYPVGMTYTPWQTWGNIYDADRALKVGTIFGDLDYPWTVGRCACR